MYSSTTPPVFHVMTKPRGAICNLDCRYCYFLKKEALYPDGVFRMNDQILEDFTRQYIEAQKVSEVTFAWQGGEPTLMGVSFYRRAVQFQEKHRRPGMQIYNAFQTNGVLLDDEWCRFFKEHDFLIGISIDGPRRMHDAYRVDKGGKPSFDKVMKGLELLKKHHVEFNVLTTVHAANADHPKEVYRFLRDRVAAQFIQFIPIVERDNVTGFQEGGKVTSRSLKARQYGRFLIAVFDEWVRQDVGRVFVQIFDVALGAWLGRPGGLCVFAPTCGTALALEHNGDLYACDHYVEPRYFLGNIQKKPLVELVASTEQRTFGQAKLDTLPRYCLECEVRLACHGGCPKNRFIKTPGGEQGLNYLCAAYKAFFAHIDRPMKIMVELIRIGKPPSEIIDILGEQTKLTQRKPRRRRGQSNI